MSQIPERFITWCRDQALPIKINKASHLGFAAYLQATERPIIARGELRQLYTAGIAGTDLAARDYLFANFPDLRRTENILRELWWPNVPRVLAAQLDVPERRRLFLELDNFFRWSQRVGQATPHDVCRTLFLGVSLTAKTRYRKLTLLCRGLDLVAPGDRHLAALRGAQHALWAEAYPTAPSPHKAPRRVPEVEELLKGFPRIPEGRPVAEETAIARRSALNLHFDLLAAKGMPFSFDRAALDVFADHAYYMLGIWCRRDEAALLGKTPAGGGRGKTGWCRMTVWSMCQRLAPFIADTMLKREWYRFAQTFLRDAKYNGDIKRKERALAERPMDLDDLYLRAIELHRLGSEETDIQIRNSIFTVVGGLGLLLFFPLRISDLLRLRIDVELVRTSKAWLLALDQTQKTESEVDPIVLPQEANPLLDACLLRGLPRAELSACYARGKGTPLLYSPRRRGSYTRGAFSDLFRRRVGHSPHVARTLWCDQMVALGADRAKIGAMLQHKSEISQKHYEVLAGKLRRLRSLEALRELS